MNGTNRMNRRSLLAASAVTALPVLAAACGAPGSGQSSANVLPDKPVDVQFWTNGPSEEAAKAQVAAWTAQHPTLRIELGYGKSVENLQGTEALVALMAAGDPPHLVKWNRPVTGSATVKQMLTAIDDLTRRDKIDVRARFYPAGIQEMLGPLDGKLYGLTYDLDNRVLYWNKAAFQQGGLGREYPRDFAEFRDMSVRFTRKNGADIEQLGFQATFGTELLYQWALANGGGQYLTADGRKCTLDSAKNVETLDYLAKLVQAQGGWDAQNTFLSRFSGVRNVSSNVVAFTNDKLAMFAATQLSVPTIYSARADTQFDMSPMPVGRKGDPPVTWAGGYAWAIPAGVKYPSVAWELMKFVTSEAGVLARTEGDKGRLSAGGQPFFYGISVGQQAIDEAMLKRFPPPAEMLPLVQRGLDQMKIAKSRPTSPVIAELWQAQKDATADAAQGKASAQAALSEQTRKIQALLDDFWATQKR